MADLSRRVSRLGARFFLTTARLVCEAIDRDLVTALTFLAIGRANVRSLVSDPAAFRPYVGLEQIPPDTLREPVSVYAIARDLRIPYETVRRHARKLCEAGLCESGPNGMVIPGRVYGTPKMLWGLDQNWRSTVDYVNAAANFGMAAPGPFPALAQDVRRHTVRLTTEYFLDSMSPLIRVSELDALGVVVLRCIGAANVEHMAENEALEAEYAGLADAPPDSERRPVSAYAVAKATALPYETTRRQCLRLIEQGFVEKAPGGGYFVPAHVSSSPRAIAGARMFFELTQGFLAELGRIGVAPGTDPDR